MPRTKKTQRLLLIGPIFTGHAARIFRINTQLLFWRGARKRCIPDFIKSLVLPLQFCPQLVDLRLNQPKHDIGFFNDRVITLLWSTWDEDIVSSNAGQGIEPGAEAFDGSADLVVLVGAHEYVSFACLRH
jgi:hypothetical protein